MQNQQLRTSKIIKTQREGHKWSPKKISRMMLLLKRWPSYWAHWLERLCMFRRWFICRGFYRWELLHRALGNQSQYLSGSWHCSTWSQLVAIKMLNEDPFIVSSDLYFLRVYDPPLHVFGTWRSDRLFTDDLKRAPHYGPAIQVTARLVILQLDYRDQDQSMETLLFFIHLPRG